MARPKPKILLEQTNKNFRSEQVLASDAIYAVFYKGKPINIRSMNNLVDTPGSIKYKKTSFSNPGYAFNLCERLNKKFKTNDFTVVKMTDGIQIEKEAD